MLANVWQGLVQRPTLSSLKVKLPNQRLPRPTILVPPIQNLKSLHITDIDPLCYPDNISLLVLGSKKLETLKLHWSPRMREASELSVNLHSYFGKLIAANARMPLKHLAFHNLFAFNENVFEDIMDRDLIESITLISSMNGTDDTADSAFMDASWKCAAPTSEHSLSGMRMLRGDKISDLHCRMLPKFSSLEKYYLVTGRKLHDYHCTHSQEKIGTYGGFTAVDSGSSKSSGRSNSDTTTSSNSTPSSAVSSVSCTTHDPSMAPFTPSTEQAPMSRLGRSYLDTIFKHHGSSLRHLLLMPQWRLSVEDLARLVHSCPNLEQVGLGLEEANFNMLRLLIPFLPKLYAIRILDNPNDSALTRNINRMNCGGQEEKIRDELWKNGFQAVSSFETSNFLQRG